MVESRINARQVGALRIAVGAIALGKGASLLARALGVGLGEGEQADFPWWLLPLALVWLGLAVALVAGWASRLSSLALMSLGIVLLFGAEGALYKNHIYLLTLVFFLLSLSDSGAALTWRRRSPVVSTVPAWPMVLMGCQLSIVYGMAAITKINEDFLSGLVFNYYFENSALPVPGFVTRSPEILIPLAVAVVAIELYAAVAIWSSRLRQSAVALALLMHLGMPLVARAPITVWDILLFAFVMFALMIPFHRVAAGSRVVVWDDSCSFCGRWVAFFRRCDAYGALRFVPMSAPAEYEHHGVQPGDALRAMHLVEPGGRVRPGYDAVCGIVKVMPGGHLVAPFMELPGVKQLGRRMYSRVAERRTCSLGAPAPGVLQESPKP